MKETHAQMKERLEKSGEYTEEEIKDMVFKQIQTDSERRVK